MIEKGRPIEKRVCPKRKTNVCAGCNPCSITTGFAGAGAFSDGKLSLSPDVGGNLPEILGYDRASALIRESDAIYLKFGADTHVYGVDKQREIQEIRRKAIGANLKLIECPIRHLGTEEGYKIYTRLQEHLLSHGVTMPMHHKKSLGPVLPDRRDKRGHKPHGPDDHELGGAAGIRDEQHHDVGDNDLGELGNAIGQHGFDRGARNGSDQKAPQESARHAGDLPDAAPETGEDGQADRAEKQVHRNRCTGPLAIQDGRKHGQGHRLQRERNRAEAHRNPRRHRKQRDRNADARNLTSIHMNSPIENKLFNTASIPGPTRGSGAFVCSPCSIPRCSQQLYFCYTSFRCPHRLAA